MPASTIRTTVAAALLGALAVTVVTAVTAFEH